MKGPRDRIRTWGALTATLCAVYLTAALTVYPSLFPDPAGGLLVRKSMQQGAPWNHITEPAPENIARDRTYFFATWSPGQYAVPGWFADRGLTLGQSLRLVCIAASLGGLAGWWLLFRTLQFDAVATVGALGLIAASRSFNLSFLTYVGSDLLAFVSFPLLALAAYRLQQTWTLVGLAPVFVVASFFFKNSMAIYLAAWIASLGLVALLNGSGRRPRLVAQLAGTGLTILGAFLLLQWAYISRGWTAVTYDPVLSLNPAKYLLPAVMPLLAATSVDDVLSRAFTFPGRDGFDYKNSVLFLLAVLLVVAGFVRHELRSRDRHPATVIAFVFVLLVIAPFTYLHGTGSRVSLELSRHYLIPGFFLLPLLVRRISLMSGTARRRTLAAAMVLPCLYGVASFASNWKRHFDHRLSYSPGLQVTQLLMTPRLVAALRALDQDLPSGNNLVVLPSPHYGLEFSRTRVLATGVTSNSLEEIVAAKRSGTVDNLVVIAEQAGTTEDETKAWLASFTSYASRSWDYVEADGFRFYVPDGQPVNRAWLEAEQAAAFGRSGR